MSQPLASRLAAVVAEKFGIRTERLADLERMLVAVAKELNTYDSDQWADTISLTKNERRVALIALEAVLPLARFIEHVGPDDFNGRVGVRVSRFSNLLERLKHENA